MKIYTFAKSISQCHGQGDYSENLHIVPAGPYESGPYPPVFKSLERAEQVKATEMEPIMEGGQRMWLKWQSWSIVELELVDA